MPVQVVARWWPGWNKKASDKDGPQAADLRKRS